MSWIHVLNNSSLTKVTLCMFIFWVSAGGQKTDCKEPPEGPTITDHILDFKNVSRDFINVSIFPLDTDCRIDLTKTQLRFRNLCSYVNVENYDDNRRPMSIPETQCCTPENNPGFNSAESALHCLADRDVFGKKLLKKVCVPVISHRVVLRRTGCSEREAVYQYSKVYEPVKVGCSCSYPYVAGSHGVLAGAVGPVPET